MSRSSVRTITLEVLWQPFGGVFDRELCHEPHATHVDADDGYGVRGDEAVDAEDRAVPARGHDERRRLQGLRRDILVVHLRDPTAVMQIEGVDERPDHFGSARNLAGLHEADELPLLSPCEGLPSH